MEQTYAKFRRLDPDKIVETVQRGHDPRQFALVAFGGAGAMHACELAASLRIPKVVVPAQAAERPRSA